MNINSMMSIKRNSFYSIYLCCIVFLAFLCSFTASATDGHKWTGANPELLGKYSAPLASYNMNPIPCTDNIIQFRDTSPSQDIAKNTVCTVKGSKIEYSHIPRSFEGIKFENDNIFYVLNNDDWMYKTLIPHTDKYLRWTPYPLYSHGGQLTIADNVSEKVVPVSDSDGRVKYYNYDDSEKAFEFKNTTGPWKVGTGVAFSSNGMWLALEVVGTGIVRINTETYEARRISTDGRGYGWGSGGDTKMAISDDGKHIIMASKSSYNTYYINNDCGDKLGEQYLSNITPVENACESKNISEYIQTQLGMEYMDPKAVKISSDGTEIDVMSNFDYDNFNESWFSLGMPNYTAPASKLDYLALGDSFSSGEGDSMSAYLDGTDVRGNKAEGIPEERCHVSQSSYPFRLQSLMNIQSDEVKSVACGGAIISDVTSGTSYEDYTDQWDRLKGLPNIDDLRNDAKQAFIPGRIQQIEFVKENKPKAITLTAGGNDLEFSGLLKSCILRQACPATNDTLKALVAKTINKMKGQLQRSYENLQQASPKTKIYVLSYPQIASDEGLFCGLNVPLLANERQYIKETIGYLNKTIESAAKSAGVKYVDIEQSLDGHKLCDDTKDVAVNGIYFDNFQIGRGSFHPNTKGHELMAAAIMNKIPGGLLAYDYCSELSRAACRQLVEDSSMPEYFAAPVAAHPENQQFAQFTDKEPVKRGSVIQINVNGLRKGAVAIVKLNGQTISELTVDSSGKIRGTVTLSNDTQVGVGIIDIHTETPSSEPIDLTQVIDIQDQNSNDVDGDGIPNANDSCQLIAPSGSDTDKDGIDDACDAVIEQIPGSNDLYRVRNGRPENGENKLYMYIERNIKRSAEIGVKNDYDTDGDGWSIVAASRNEGEMGVATRFWVDANKKPHITVRTAERGCVQYTAQKLTRVTNKPVERKIIREASFADNCRPDEPGADVDKNNVADNVQQLYRAYNGDPAKGEDPARVYLDRNLHASEAQLGISDYAPLNDQLAPQSWNRLAGALTNKTKGTFSALVMTNKMINGKSTPFPVILLKDKANKCFAVEPQNVDTIIKSQQAKMTLVPVAMPAGHNCQ